MNEQNNQINNQINGNQVPVQPVQNNINQTVQPQPVEAQPVQNEVNQTVQPQPVEAQPVQNNINQAVQSQPVEAQSVQNEVNQTVQPQPVEAQPVQNNMNQNNQSEAVVQPEVETVIDPLQGLVNSNGPQQNTIQQELNTVNQNTQQLAVIDPLQGIVNQDQQPDPMQQIQNNANQQPVQQQTVQNGMMNQPMQQPMQQSMQNGMINQPMQQPMQNGMMNQPMQQPMQNGMMNQGISQQGQMPLPMQNGMMNQPSLQPKPEEQIPGEDDDVINFKDSKGAKIFSIITVAVVLLIIAKIFLFSPKWIEDVKMKSYVCLNNDCSIELDSGTSYKVDIQSSLAKVVLDKYSDYIKVDLYCEKALFGDNKVLDYKLFLKEDGKEITSEVSSEKEIRQLLGLLTEGNHTEELTLLEIGEKMFGATDDQTYYVVNYTFKNDKDEKFEMEYRSKASFISNPLELEVGNKYNVTFNVSIDSFGDYSYLLIRAD